MEWPIRKRSMVTPSTPGTNKCSPVRRSMKIRRMTPVNVLTTGISKTLDSIKWRFWPRLLQPAIQDSEPPVGLARRFAQCTPMPSPGQT